MTIIKNMEKKKLIKELSNRQDRYVCLFRYREAIKKDWCFSDILEGRVPNNFKTEIYVYKSKIFNEGGNHITLLNDNDIKYWLYLVEKYFGGIVGYTIDKEKVSINVDYSKIKYHKNNAGTLTVLTCIRYLYEYPYNVLLHDAFKAFKKYNKFTLLTWLLIFHTSRSFGRGHSLISKVIDYYGDSYQKKKLIYRRFDYKIYRLSKEIFSNNEIFNKMPIIENDNLIKFIKKVIDEEKSF